MLSATIFFSCSAIKEPVLKGIDELKVNGISLNQPRLIVHLNYFNPNRSGLRLKDATGDVWIDNSFLGRFNMDTSIKISGLSDFIIPVMLDVDMKNAMKNAATLLFKPVVSFKIEGKARIGKSGIFINYPIRYEGKQDLSKLLQ